MKHKLHFPVESVLEAIDTADSSLDVTALGRKILEIFFHTFPVEGGVFFLPDGHFGFKETILKNFDEKYNHDYKVYYHQFDPLRLMQAPSGARSGKTRVEVVNYAPMISTEYYTDFLKPQGIHYKLVIYLEAQEGLLGKIVLARSRGSAPFTGREVRMANELSPYLTHMLVHNNLRRKMLFKDRLLTLIENDLDAGIIVLDEYTRPIYMNRRARELCEQIADRSARQRSVVPPLLVADCRQMIEKRKVYPAGGLVLPMRRTVTVREARQLAVCSRLIESGSGPGLFRFFMIRLEEKSPPRMVDWEQVRALFRLSAREVDIVSHIFQGLQNAEIAERLFVSEITVKKHIQNIYEKAGVKNRTSLINKILTADSPACLCGLPASI